MKKLLLFVLALSTNVFAFGTSEITIAGEGQGELKLTFVGANYQGKTFDVKRMSTVAINSNYSGDEKTILMALHSIYNGDNSANIFKDPTQATKYLDYFKQISFAKVEAVIFYDGIYNVFVENSINGKDVYVVKYNFVINDKGKALLSIDDKEDNDLSKMNLGDYLIKHLNK